MGWRLKLYSGLNQGVEVDLPMGTVRLGSDPLEADLVLNDAGIPAVLLELEVDEQGVKLINHDEDNLYRQDGEQLVQGEALKAGARQECGELLWCFLDSERSFPEALPSFHTESTARVKPKKGKGGAILAGLSLVLVCSLAMMISEPWWRARNLDATITPLERLQQYQKQHQLSQLVFENGDKNQLISIKGFLPDNTSRVALQQFLEQKAIAAKLDVRTNEELLQGVEFILQKLGYEQLAVSSIDKGGWIRLQGELEKEDKHWTELESLLKRDVPGLLGVENQVRLAGAPLKRLDELLVNAGLKEVLSLQERGDRIEFRGQLNETQLDAFYVLQQNFKKEFGNRPVLALLATRSDRPEELDFDVRSVSIGRVPYVVLANNQKYPVGAVTDSGLRVLAINSNVVLVSNGKQQYLVKLKGAIDDDNFRATTVQR